MTGKRLISDVRALASPEGLAGLFSPRRQSAPRGFGGLRWQQWLVFFGLGVAIIVTEVHDHTTMWREHQSGQTLLTDRHLLMELFLYGLLLPFLAGVIADRVGRTTRERDEMAQELALQRTFVAHLQEVQTWDQLAQLVVTLPRTIAPADRAWLLAQRIGQEEFHQVARWEAPDGASGPCLMEVTPSICEQCVRDTALQGPALLTCHQRGPGRSEIDCTRYCLWLSLEETGKTALVFDLPPGGALDLRQMKTLDDLGDQIALAISSANLHDVRQQQDDVAQSERLRIARDIHDTLAQNISYLRLKLEQINAAGPEAAPIQLQEDLSKMLVVAEEAYEQVRDTLVELRTAPQQDLAQTIRLYAAEVAQRNGFSVQVLARGGTKRLSPTQSRQLMYIVREALNNIEKHANANTVDIQLEWQEDQFSLIVSDDGCGFDPAEVNPENHYGMAIIAERSNAINATFSVESLPHVGTRLTVRLPLSKQSNSSPSSR